MTNADLMYDPSTEAESRSQKGGPTNPDSRSVHSGRSEHIAENLAPNKHIDYDSAANVEEGVKTNAEDQEGNVHNSQIVHSLELQMGDMEDSAQDSYGTDIKANASSSFTVVHESHYESNSDDESTNSINVVQSSNLSPKGHGHQSKAKIQSALQGRTKVAPPQNKSTIGPKPKKNATAGNTGIHTAATIPVLSGQPKKNATAGNTGIHTAATIPVLSGQPKKNATAGNTGIHTAATIPVLSGQPNKNATAGNIGIHTAATIPILSGQVIRRSDNYPPDCYSFLSLYGPRDDYTFFGMGLLVFIFQITLILMMFLSVLHPQWGTNGDSDNPGQDIIAKIVAANASPVVRYTQYAALMAYVLFAEASMLDITTAVETFPSFSKAAGGDKVGCMAFSCALRFLQGAMAMLAALLLIITSETAVDIVLNFTAINFISNLDNAAFRLAILGKYGPKLELEAIRITSLQLPPCMSRNDKYTLFRGTTASLGMMLILLISGIIVFQEREDTWCTQVLRVEFQNENLQTYSGCYGIDKDGAIAIDTYKRNVYKSSEEYGASLGYCIDDRRWKFFKNGTDACKAEDDELAYSSKTNAFDVSTVFVEAWFSASGAPLDLYFIELNTGATDLEDQCSMLDNGLCNVNFNELDFKYDGGDCCSATCSHSICGIATLKEAFGVPIVTGNGFPHCKDPNMVPISIHLGEFTESEDKRIRKDKYDTQNPDLLLECDGKTVLSLVLSKEMSNSTQTVHVSDRAVCALNVKNITYEETVIWHVDYSVFVGDRTANDRKIIEGNSGLDGVVSFLTIPECMLEQLSTHFDIKTMYNEIHTKQALYWMVNDPTGNSDCRDVFFVERFALSVLSFSAPVSDADTSWVTTNPTCLWFTTTCTNDGLSELNLEYMKLQGTIPPSIGLLTSFSRVDIGGNLLTGSIPTEIGRLTSLEYLGLRVNGFIGSIPSEIGLMSKLETVVLSGNVLTGWIPSQIGNLSSLEYFVLSSNKLNGKIPSEIRLLSSLKSLVLKENELTGSIPSEIGRLSGLTDLEITSNKFIGSIPSDIGTVSNLISLWLGKNWLWGVIPTEIGLLSILEQISLEGNILTGNIPSEIGWMSNTLWYLSMNDNALSGTIPSEIGLLSNLEILNLDGNALTGSFPSEIGHMTSISIFWFEGNALTGSIPSEIGQMSSLKNLWLDDNMLTGSMPSEIGRLLTLETIYLNGNALTGSIPSVIGQMSSLLHVYIKGNQLTGTLPTQIGRLTNFQYLNLRENKLTGSIPSEVGFISSLVTLSLWSNALTGRIPSEIGLLFKMESIYFDGNALTGTIPTEIGRLSSLIYLDLFENALSGTIPTEIGNLFNLTRLNLENNILTGPIPSELGLLTSVDCFALLAGNDFTFIPIEVEGRLC